MAARARKTAAPVETEEVEETVAELTPKQIVNAGIARFTESTSVEGQHFRYKALRAIAYQAFVESIDNGDFDELVDRAIANSGDLPAGFELERAPKDDAPAKAKAAPKAKATGKNKSAPAKAPAAKTGRVTAKATTPRKRPTR